MRTAQLGFFLALGLTPAFAAASPGPIGPDIPVASTSAECPAVAMSANGDFEVVWSLPFSESHPSPQGIFARHFDREGTPTQPAAVRLDVPSPKEATFARVIPLPDGGYFAVWWEDFSRRRTETATVGRILDPTGRPRGPVLLLVPNRTLVALTVVNDDLLVAWKDTANGVLRARRFDFAGLPVRFVMHLTNHATLGTVDVAPLADSFVAVWERWTGSSWVVEAQRFSLVGKARGAALRMNENPPGGQFRVKVASDGSERFAVAWTKRRLRSDPQTGQQFFDDKPRVQFFDAGGSIGPPARPNQFSTGDQPATGLAMDHRGVALVTWYTDRNSHTSDLDVLGRFVDPSGRPVGEEFSLSENLAGNDFCPVAATDDDGAWVVAWLKQSTGVYARRLTF